MPQAQRRLQCEALNSWVKLDECLWLDDGFCVSFLLNVLE